MVLGGDLKAFMFSKLEGMSLHFWALHDNFLLVLYVRSSLIIFQLVQRSVLSTPVECLKLFTWCTSINILSSKLRFDGNFKDITYPWRLISVLVTQWTIIWIRNVVYAQNWGGRTWNMNFHFSQKPILQIILKSFCEQEKARWDPCHSAGRFALQTLRWNRSVDWWIQESGVNLGTRKASRTLWTAPAITFYSLSYIYSTTRQIPENLSFTWLMAVRVIIQTVSSPCYVLRR